MSIFPTKILLATDGSRDAELALSTAVDLANTTDSELHVVTVAPGYPSYDVRIPDVVESLRQRAEGILEDQTKKIQQIGGGSCSEAPEGVRTIPGRADRPGCRGYRSRPHRHG